MLKRQHQNPRPPFPFFSLQRLHLSHRGGPGSSPLLSHQLQMKKHLLLQKVPVDAPAWLRLDRLGSQAYPSTHLSGQAWMEVPSFPTQAYLIKHWGRKLTHCNTAERMWMSSESQRHPAHMLDTPQWQSRRGGGREGGPWMKQDSISAVSLLS